VPVLIFVIVIVILIIATMITFGLSLYFLVFLTYFSVSVQEINVGKHSENEATDDNGYDYYDDSDSGSSCCW
jgi:hypothetical protein